MRAGIVAIKLRERVAGARNHPNLLVLPIHFGIDSPRSTANKKVGHSHSFPSWRGYESYRVIARQVLGNVPGYAQTCRPN